MSFLDMFSGLTGQMSTDMAIDLGTANTLVAIPGEGIVVNEPSVVAIEKATHRVLAVGHEAKNMINHTPEAFSAEHPLHDGVVADYDVTEAMISAFISKAAPRKYPWQAKPRIVICIPCGATSVEKRAVFEAAIPAGARQAYLIEEPMAAAMGADLPVTEPTGSMVVDIGGGTTEVAVISLGGIVASSSLRLAGTRLDEAIASRGDCRRASVGETRLDFTPDPAKSFTRGESEYFLMGRSAGVASFDTPKSVGEFVGRVAACDVRGFTLDRDAALAAGDGICIGADGTNVNSVEGRRIAPNRMPASIRPGAAVYRNLDSRFRLQLEHSRMRRVIPAEACVTVASDRVTFRYTDCEGLSAEASREGVFEPAGDPAKMADGLRTQAARSGDTPFDVQRVEVTGAEWFVPLSLAGALRREALAELRRLRVARVPEHRILAEDPCAPYPAAALSAEGNVTNRLAERFYRDHGVTRIERGLDLEASTAGRRVMRSAYCIRREIGECLLEGSRLDGDLFLVRGAKRYRLAFDCARCEMSLIDEK